MTLFIHIGIGKTGTTAIQDCLYADRTLLQSQGFVYPETGLKGTGHHGLAPIGYTEGSPTIERAWQTICQSARESAQHIVLSSENLSYITATHAQNCFSWLKGLDVKIIFYVRNQVSLIQSSYPQFQKIGAEYPRGIEKFWELQPNSFDFYKLITPWVEAFGAESIIVQLYNPQVIGANIYQHFCNLIGAPYSGQNTVPVKTNHSLLPYFSRLIEKIDRVPMASLERNLIINEFLVCSQILKKSSGIRLIDHHFSKKIMAYYLASNQKMADTFMSRVQANLFLHNF